MSDVDLYFDGSFPESDGAIVVHTDDFKRANVWLFIFVRALISHNNFISWLIVVLNSCAIFTTIVLLNYLLLSLLDCSPIGNVLDIKYHVSSKDKLSWSAPCM